MHIYLPRRSVLVLAGNGADVAKHCIPRVSQERISVTLRKMRPQFYRQIEAEQSLQTPELPIFKPSPAIQSRADMAKVPPLDLPAPAQAQGRGQRQAQAQAQANALQFTSSSEPYTPTTGEGGAWAAVASAGGSQKSSPRAAHTLLSSRTAQSQSQSEQPKQTSPPNRERRPSLDRSKTGTLSPPLSSPQWGKLKPAVKNELQRLSAKGLFSEDHVFDTKVITELINLNETNGVKVIKELEGSLTNRAQINQIKNFSAYVTSLCKQKSRPAPTR